MENQYGRRFRELMNDNDFLLLPGVYDGFSAKVTKEAGFEAQFLSGGSLAICRMGKPDLGFLYPKEVSDAAHYIVDTISAPLIVDIDNGFGNALHAATIGATLDGQRVAGVQMDDKVLPALKPKDSSTIPWELMRPKIKALRDAVSDDFVIIYRTVCNMDPDAGLDESIRRVNLAADAGADYAYIDGLKNSEELEKAAAETKIGMLVNMNEKGFPATQEISRLKELGYLAGLYPMSLLLAARKGIQTVLEELRRTGSTLGARDQMTDAVETHNLMGRSSLPEFYDSYYHERRI